MTPDIILAIGAFAGVGIAALRIAESNAQRRDAAADAKHDADLRESRIRARIADEQRLDEESIDRAVADVRVLLREEIAQHATNAEFRQVTQGLDVPQWPTS